MTDKEVIKALECCVDWCGNVSCWDCPLKNTGCIHFDKLKETLDLINRLQARVDDLERNDLPRCKDALRRANEIGVELQAENERLNKNLETETNHITRLENQIERLLSRLGTIKAEAYKECIEKVSELICDNTYPDFDKDGKAVNIWSAKGGYKQIDNLLKEMVGDNDE